MDSNNERDTAVTTPYPAAPSGAGQGAGRWAAPWQQPPPCQAPAVAAAAACPPPGPSRLLRRRLRALRGNAWPHGGAAPPRAQRRLWRDALPATPHGPAPCAAALQPRPRPAWLDGLGPANRGAAPHSRRSVPLRAPAGAWRRRSARLRPTYVLGCGVTLLPGGLLVEAGVSGKGGWVTSAAAVGGGTLGAAVRHRRQPTCQRQELDSPLRAARFEVHEVGTEGRRVARGSEVQSKACESGRVPIPDTRALFGHTRECSGEAGDLHLPLPCWRSRQPTRARCASDPCIACTSLGVLERRWLR